MAALTQNGITTLTPTPWKWYLGAAAAFFMVPGFGFILAIFLVLTGLGKLQKLTLTPQGMVVQNWWQRKAYRWSEVNDLRVHSVHYGLIKAANMVSFTHADQEGTMLGKAAKLLSGGTHSVPVIGMKAKDQAALMQAYKMGYIPADTPLELAAPSPLPQPQTANLERPSPAANRGSILQEPRPIKAVTPKYKPALRKSAVTKGKQKPLIQKGGGLFG